MTCAFIGIIISLRHVCILRESRPMSPGRVSYDSFIHHHHPPPWPRSEASVPWKHLSCSRKCINVLSCQHMSNKSMHCQYVYFVHFHPHEIVSLSKSNIIITQHEMAASFSSSVYTVHSVIIQFHHHHFLESSRHSVYHQHMCSVYQYSVYIKQ